jgi:hypothetical protein
MRIQLPETAKRPRPFRCEWRWSDKFCLVFLLFLLMECCRGAAAQGLISPQGTNSAPGLGSTGGMRPPTQLPLLNGTQHAGVKMHLGPTGKPCLTMFGHAEPQIVNPDIFNHIIMASNDCSQPIKVRVCYYQSQQCIPLDVPGYGRKEVVLGIMPAMNQFRFEYREQFDQGMGGLGTGLN